MSISKFRETRPNPTKRFYSWSGEKAQFYFWDKVDEQRVFVDSIEFIPIDTLACVEGYNATKEMGFRSNEVHYTGKETMTVRYNRGNEIISGLYKDIKGTIKEMGGKFNQSIYAIEKIDDEWEIINIKLKGSGLSAWLNIINKLSIPVEGLLLKTGKSEEKKMGRVVYFEPTFQVSKPSSDLHKVAVDKDEILQEYFEMKKESGNFSKPDQVELSAEEQEKLEEMKKGNGTKKERHKSEVNNATDEDDFFNDF